MFKLLSLGLSGCDAEMSAQIQSKHRQSGSFLLRRKWPALLCLLWKFGLRSFLDALSLQQDPKLMPVNLEYDHLCTGSGCLH